MVFPVWLAYDKTRQRSYLVYSISRMLLTICHLIFRSPIRRRPSLTGLTLIAACSLSLGFASLHAQELPQILKQDAPFINSPTTPAWIKFSSDIPSTFANVSFQLIPPFPSAQDLLLTVVFDEQPSGFLRASFQTNQIAETLSDNLMEGTQGTNQRTILIKNLSGIDPTTITLQSGSATLPVKRLILNWLKPQTVLSDASGQGTVALRGNISLREPDLSGAPLTAPGLFFADNYVHAPLQDQAESLGDGITFIVTLDQVPAHVRLTSRIMSPSLLNRLTCHVNGQVVPDFTTSPPSLRDPAYFWTSNPPYYSGWLPASIYLPGSLWHVGDNIIELSQVDFAGHPATEILSIRDTVLEVLFPPPQTSTSPQSPTDQVLPSPSP